MRARANDIEIEYETFGGRREGAAPLLLIMGLGSQMVRWHEDFCRMLADRGHFVVRYDNRDVGRSTILNAAGLPDFSGKIRRFSAPYLLADMAADAVGLLDFLGVEKAHVCGLSMGGMIAQTMAILFPERLSSLISMESTTGDPGLPPPTRKAMAAFMRLAPSGREAYIEHEAALFEAFSSGSPAFDIEMEKHLAAVCFDRGIHPTGVARQIAAIMASGSRKQALAKVRAPALVIHGLADPLVPPEHGQATAEAIPGAGLLMIEDLGHGLSYPSLWPRIADAISGHAKALP